MKYKNLFTPVQIGRVTLKNRFALAPMGPLGLADAQGGFNQRGIDYYTDRAKGGTGLIITGVTFSDCRVEAQLSQFHLQSGTFYPDQQGDDRACSRVRQQDFSHDVRGLWPCHHTHQPGRVPAGCAIRHSSQMAG